MTDEQLSALRDAEAWADELIAEILEPAAEPVEPAAVVAPDVTTDVSEASDTPDAPEVTEAEVQADNEDDPDDPTAIAVPGPPPPPPPVVRELTIGPAFRLPSEIAYVLGPDDFDPSSSGTAPAVLVIRGDGASAPVPRIPGDVVPLRKRWLSGAKAAILLGIMTGLLALGGAGVSYAAFDHGRDYAGLIYPGTVIAGVDVGGMNREEALNAVNRAIEPQLTRTIHLRWRDRKWEVTPEKLGAVSDAEKAVDAALYQSAQAPFFDRARMRILGDGLGFEEEIAIDYPEESVHGFIEGLAASINRPVRDASVDYSSGVLEVEKEQVGMKVRVETSFQSLTAALEHGASTAPLSLRIENPTTTTADYGEVLFLRLDQNRLYLYDQGKVIREYTVATGAPGYYTPSGEYEIVEKRYMPTWVNPAPTGWGAGMPASIGPGYSNPLGLRALNWSVPAIRFHGTSNIASLGSYASHGCVRMANEDVIELYDLVDVGTPIISTWGPSSS